MSTGVLQALLSLGLLVGVPQETEAIPLDLDFLDEAGNVTTLRRAAAGKPFLLAPLCLRCSESCAQVLEGLLQLLKGTIPRAGKQFQVVTLSLDPREDAALAAARKSSCLKRYERPGAAQGWKFLTGRPESIERLCGALGFRAACDHPDVLIVLSAEGRISRRFHGVRFPPRDLRLAIAEASEGKSRSFIDPALLYCYRYDPATERYGIAVPRLLGLAALILLALLALPLHRLVRRWLECRASITA